MSRKTRKDYKMNHRNLLELLEDNRKYLQIPYFPVEKLSNKELARIMEVNERTIRRHKKKITSKQQNKNPII